MKYTKKYNQKRKPKTHKKRPNRKSKKSRKSRKHGKKGGRYIPFFSTKKDVETKQQQLNAFNEKFPYENDTYGKKRNKLIYKVQDIAGNKEDIIFDKFNVLYNELLSPTLECKNDTRYTTLNICETEKLKYYNDLLDSLNKIEEKLNNTESEDRPTFDYNFKVQDNAGLVTEPDENKNVEKYELTDKDFVKISKMKKQIKKLQRYANDKINEHKSKLGIKVLTPDEMEKQNKEDEIKRLVKIDQDAAKEYKKLHPEKNV